MCLFSLVGQKLQEKIDAGPGDDAEPQDVKPTSTTTTSSTTTGYSYNINLYMAQH
jgi:hypothetical protein